MIYTSQNVFKYIAKFKMHEHFVKCQKKSNVKIATTSPSCPEAIEENVKKMYVKNWFDPRK